MFLNGFYVATKKRKECTVVFSHSQGSCRAHSADLVRVDSLGESDFIEAEVIMLRGRNIYIFIYFIQDLSICL